MGRREAFRIFPAGVEIISPLPVFYVKEETEEMEETEGGCEMEVVANGGDRRDA